MPDDIEWTPDEEQFDQYFAERGYDEEFDATVKLLDRLPVELGRLVGDCLIAVMDYGDTCGWPPDEQRQDWQAKFMRGLREGMTIGRAAGPMSSTRMTSRPAIIDELSTWMPQIIALRDAITQSIRGK